MIDLCKLFGVEEGEEFKIGTYENPYRIYNNSLQSFDTDFEEWRKSPIMFNYVISSDIIKLPKKKQFTDDELCVLRNVDKKWSWIARDIDGKLYLYHEKPVKTEELNGKWTGSEWIDFYMYDHLFQSIQWEDEEPVFIDDYIER